MILLTRWRLRFPGKWHVMVWVVAVGVMWFSGVWFVADRMTRRQSPRVAEQLPGADWARFSEYRIRTGDGEELGAWLDETPNRSGPIILITHGNGGRRTAALHVAELVARFGYRSLLISHRAHGDSSGDRNDFGYSARQDIIAAVQFLKDREPDAEVVIWGRSLGAAAAIFAAPDLEGLVQGLILECPYKDLHTAVWHRAENNLPPVLSHAAFLSLRTLAPLVLPHFREISPERGAAAVPRGLPVLLLCGGQDQRARTFEAQALHRVLGERSQLVEIREGDHLKLHMADPERYSSAVLSFISGVTRESLIED